MNIPKHSIKTVLAAALIAASFGTAMAAESGGGDRGPNNMNPRANDSKGIDTRMNSGEDMKMRNQRYTDSMYSAKQDYNTALVNCKEVARNDRSDCRREARSTRDEAYADARSRRQMRVERNEVNRDAGVTAPGERANASVKP